MTGTQLLTPNSPGSTSTLHGDCSDCLTLQSRFRSIVANTIRLEGPGPAVLLSFLSPGQFINEIESPALTSWLSAAFHGLLSHRTASCSGSGRKLIFGACIFRTSLGILCVAHHYFFTCPIPAFQHRHSLLASIPGFRGSLVHCPV